MPPTIFLFVIKISITKALDKFLKTSNIKSAMNRSFVLFECICILKWFEIKYTLNGSILKLENNCNSNRTH